MAIRKKGSAKSKRVARINTRTFASLHAQGYEPLPADGKGVYLPGWTTMDVAPHVAAWDQGEWGTRKRSDGTTGPMSNGNIGLRCGLLRGFDIDIRDAELAQAIEDAIRSEFKLNGTPTRTGLAPKRLLPLRAAQVGRKRQITLHKPGLEKPYKVEVLGEGQQFIAFGIHPDTDEPYQWDAPLPPLDQLPEVTDADIERMLDIAGRLAVAHGYTLQAAQKPTGEADAPPKPSPTGEPLEQRLSFARACLVRLPNEKDGAVSWDDWKKVAGILHHFLPDAPAEARAMFEEFSRRHPRHGERETRKGWKEARTFTQVTFGTLLKMARDALGDSQWHPADTLPSAKSSADGRPTRAELLEKHPGDFFSTDEDVPNLTRGTDEWFAQAYRLAGFDPDPASPKDGQPKPEALLEILLDRTQRAGADLLDEQLADKEHVVANLLPVDVSIVGAGSGQRKTMLMLQEAAVIAAAAAGGGGWLYGNEVLRPGRVLYIHAEDDNREMRRRVQRIANSYADETVRRAIVEGIVLLDVSDLLVSLIGHNRETGQFFRGALADALVEVVEQVAPVWVVIDPTANVQRYEDRALNDSWATLIQTVRQNVARTGVAHTLVHHLSQEATINKSIHETALRGGTQFSNGSKFTRIIHTVREAECDDPEMADSKGGKKLLLPESISMDAVREGRVLRIHTAKNSHGPCNLDLPQFAVFDYGRDDQSRPKVGVTLYAALHAPEVAEKLTSRRVAARDAALVRENTRKEAYLRALRAMISSQGEGEAVYQRDVGRNPVKLAQLRLLAQDHGGQDSTPPSQREMQGWVEGWLAGGVLRGVPASNRRIRLEVP